MIKVENICTNNIRDLFNKNLFIIEENKCYFKFILMNDETLKE